MSQLRMEPNEGKALVCEIDGEKYARIPLKTHVITGKDKMEDIMKQYVAPIAEEEDIAFMSEKSISCMQKRAVPLKDIKPRWLAKKLSRFVYKNPHGIGLSMPETMEMALRECGTPKILFAAAISAVGKLFGKRGWFYMIAGDAARSIDGPTPYTLPPYNEYVVLGPLEPTQTAVEAAKFAGIPVVVVDLNDLGGNILGKSSEDIDTKWLLKILDDNPLGQGSEQTPIGIIRKV